MPAEGCLNLIHVDDAASVVLAAERQAPLPRLYVVSDGHPVERRIYYQELARLLYAPPPRFVAAAARQPSRRRARRATSASTIARMRDELAVHLAYPSYREGLAAIVAAEEAGD